MRKAALALVLATAISLTQAEWRPDDIFVREPTSQGSPQLTVAAAQKLYWDGSYDKAADICRKLVAASVDVVPAAVGLAEAQSAVGQYEDALASLDAVAARADGWADWHICRSDVLAQVGRYEDALAAARRAAQVQPDWAPAIFCLGQAQERLGLKEQAVETYKSIETAIAKPGFRGDSRSLVAAGEALDRYGILVGRKASELAQNVLQNYYQHATLDLDKTYWPAHLAAGKLLLEKHKPADAAKEYALAEKINPNLPDVFVARAVILLQRYDFERAFAEADKALKINPRCADALLVRAAGNFLWRKLDEVAPEIDKVLQVNPNHLEALSMMAALRIRSTDETKAQPYIERVEKVNPRYGELYEEIGDWLSTARQYKQAEKFYRKAMEVSPELAGPVTGLGTLYMQTGREDLAEEMLAKAFELDDFRADVLNYLRLVRKLNSPEAFMAKETEHFIIKVDPKHDEVLLEWVARTAERIHNEVAKDFDHTPPEKTLIELFPDHAGFSVRISGRGAIPTVGACTGRVVAMPAPDPLRGGAGTFNWAVVLRHEYTHTVTLSATENRIPHWFTEACAVWEQPDRRNYKAVGLLLDAVRTDRLYPVKDLSWGFIRPDRRRGPDPRSMAYAQAEWIFEYIVEKKGYETILKMLDGFREGLEQEEVFRTVLGVSQEQFDKDFKPWAVEQVRSWGFDPSPRPPLAEAARVAKAQPASADAQANLAAAFFESKRMPQAIGAARKALGIDPKHPRALEALAGALSATNKHEEAVETAAKLQQVKPEAAIIARVQAEAYLDQQRWPEAIAALETYKHRRRLDPYAYEKLSKLYMQLGRTDKALPDLLELQRCSLKDAKYARQIADIYQAADDVDNALSFFEQVIQINPYDAGAYQAMASLYLRKGDYDGAILAMRSSCLTDPKNADSWAKLAMVYYRAALAEKAPCRLSEARAAAEKGMALDPQGPAADVLQMIEQAGDL